MFSSLRVFFSPVARIQGVVHLVQSAFGVQAQTFQPAFVRILDEIIDGKELAVVLHANREGQVIASPGKRMLFVRQRVAHLGFVRVVRQQIDVVHPVQIVRQAEAVIAREVDVHALLAGVKAGGRLAVQIEEHVVVEFPVVEQRAARTGAGHRGACAFG